MGAPMTMISRGAKSLRPIKTSFSSTEGAATSSDAAAAVASAVEMEEEEELLSPGARVFLEPAMNCCVVAVVGAETAIDVDVVKDGLRRTLIKHPRFSSKLVVDAKKGGKKTWVRTQVDLEDHVIVPDLDLDMDCPDQFVEDYVSRLTTIPIDLTKPLWELHLLNIKTSKAKGICVLRIHHSLGDGISLISLLLACTRKTSDPNSLPSLPTKNETKASSSSSRNRLWRLLVAVLFAFKLLWNTTVHMAEFLATMLFLKDMNTSITCHPGTEKNPRRIVYRIVKLDDIKLVKNEMNATINDVMMGLVQAGLSRYLNRKYGNANRVQGATEKQVNHPKKTRLRACLLVNVRPSSGIQELASMMEKGSKCPWGNAIGYVILPFRIDWRDDPLDYIRQAKATLDQKKQSLEAKLTYASAMLILKLFGEKVVAALSHRVVAHTTMSFSNVVGPVDEISFYGHPIAYIAPSVYGHPQALTIHFQSHANKMTIVVGVDETVVADPHQLCDDLEDSLKQIKNIILARRKLTRDDRNAKAT